MANPTLHWRMLAPVFVPNPSTAGLLDALYQMGTATTYADGTTRTPGTFTTPGTASLPATLGTGSAWTWNFDNTTFGTGNKTAIYGYAPTTTAMNQAVAICGSSNTAGAVWKQLFSDPRLANLLFMGIAKNSGVYTSWNNATTPFSVGDFTGLGALTATATLYSLVYMWESEEAVIVQVVNTAAGTTSNGAAGAFIDPLSANTTNAELDGRLYGVSVTGSSNYMAAAWLGSTTAANAPLFYNANTASDQHSVTFTPGAGTLTNLNAGGAAVRGTWRSGSSRWPEHSLELRRQGVRDEATATRIEVPVATRCLLCHIETMRHQQMQVLLGAGHGHVEQTAFFLNLVLRFGAQVRRDATVHHIEHMNRSPLLTFGRVDG